MKRRAPFPLPASVLEGDIAILGKKGGGKTVTGKGLVEELLELKQRVLVLDVLGVWAGLRTSADGKKPGYPVAIFGGEHGDLPIDPAGASALAGVLATENLPAVIDLSELSKADQNRFVGAFLAELRRVNKQALTLVLEEADVFAPQNPMGDDSKRVSSEIDWIARRGRFKGFRLITITQRPARLAKDVLTQANALIIHRLPAPQDREAVKAWVDGNGDREQAKEVFRTLAGLDVGEAWVYVQDPAMLERVRFPLMRTLDTSSTPKAGEARIEQKTLAQVDVAGLRAALTAVAPAKARPRSGGAPEPAAAPAVDVAALEAAAKAGYDRGFEHGFGQARQQLKAAVMFAMDDFGAFMIKKLEAESLQTPSATGRQLLADLAGPVPTTPVATDLAPRQARLATARAAIDTVVAGRAEGLTTPQQKLLDAIAWWGAISIPDPTLHQVGFVAGYAQGGTFDRYRSALRSSGLIDYPRSGRIELTEAGLAVARRPDTPPTQEAFHVAVRAQLTIPHERMLDPLLKAWPGELSLAELGEAAGYSAGGTFDRYRSALRSLDLITYPRPGYARASDWLFPQGLASR